MLATGSNVRLLLRLVVFLRPSIGFNFFVFFDIILNKKERQNFRGNFALDTKATVHCSSVPVGDSLVWIMPSAWSP